VGVDHGGFDAFVAEEFLDGANVISLSDITDPPLLVLKLAREFSLF
jgi:hypothetical protein